MALTGYGTQENRKKLEEAGGVDALLLKPLDLKKLKDITQPFLELTFALKS